jgi:hypothetical protein
LKPDGALDTPGIRFARGGRLDPEMESRLPRPDSYLEAAVLLAMQTPDTCTGGVFYDSEAVARFADEVTKARLRKA